MVFDDSMGNENKLPNRVMIYYLDLYKVFDRTLNIFERHAKFFELVFRRDELKLYKDDFIKTNYYNNYTEFNTYEIIPIDYNGKIVLISDSNFSSPNADTMVFLLSHEYRE